jgi:orotate phosphoribosyltransferase
VCLVLVVAIVAIALEVRHDILAGPAIGGLAAAIVAIVRHRW